MFERHPDAPATWKLKERDGGGGGGGALAVVGEKEPLRAPPHLISGGKEEGASASMFSGHGASASA